MLDPLGAVHVDRQLADVGVPDVVGGKHRAVRPRDRVPGGHWERRGDRGSSNTRSGDEDSDGGSADKTSHEVSIGTWHS